MSDDLSFMVFDWILSLSSGLHFIAILILIIYCLFMVFRDEF